MEMKGKYVIILLAFLCFVLLGSYAMVDNKYIVAFGPLLCCAIVLYVLREEWTQADVNALLRSAATYQWYGKALRYGLLVLVGTTILSGFVFQGQPAFPFADMPYTSYAVAPLYLAVVAPVMEEIVFRRLLLRGLERMMAFWPAAVLTSLLFSAGHMNLELSFTYLGVSLVFCYIYRRSGSLAIPIAAHMTMNLISLLAMTLQS